MTSLPTAVFLRDFQEIVVMEVGQPAVPQFRASAPLFRLFVRQGAVVDLFPSNHRVGKFIGFLSESVRTERRRSRGLYKNPRPIFDLGLTRDFGFPFPFLIVVYIHHESKKLVGVVEQLLVSVTQAHPIRCSLLAVMNSYPLRGLLFTNDVFASGRSRRRIDSNARNLKKFWCVHGASLKGRGRASVQGARSGPQKMPGATRQRTIVCQDLAERKKLK